MKRILPVVLLISALALPAAAPKRGKERLRELAVIPVLSLTVGASLNSYATLAELEDERSPADKIAGLRGELKEDPENIHKQLQLGDLLENTGDTNAAMVCFQRAEQLCRSKIEVRPHDGLILTDLGDALFELGKHEEAESVYRKAASVSSNQWQCWAGLGRFLTQRSLTLAWPDAPESSVFASPDKLLPKAPDSRPSLEALRQAEEFREEAARCFDRAVALAPNEPDPLLLRAMHRRNIQIVGAIFERFRREEPLDEGQFMSAIVSDAIVLDLKRAIRLAPNSYKLIGATTWMEFASAKIDSKTSATEELPDKTRESILASITRLEDLGQNGDRKVAAGALEMLATLRFLMSDGVLSSATPDARRAVALDPTRKLSWELLMGSLVGSNSPEELISVCQQRLKHEDTARNRLFLAKALAKAGKWDKAIEQAETAVRLETNSITAHLMTAALVLRQSADQELLPKAMRHLDQARALLDEMPADDERATRRREFTLNVGIFAYLSDRPAEAKEFIEMVLKHDSDDEEAKEILSAMSGTE